MLVGEYAVVDGAPALVLAIDRGVSCRIFDGPGLAIETPDGDDRFVRPALTEAEGRFVFGAWNPVTLPGKPGFGGSASACVAACVAAGRPAGDAFAIHHAVQGSGSGIDVAAAIHGGLIRFASGSVTPVPEPSPPVIVYSGRSAKTGPRVQQYRAWAGRDDFVTESARLVEAFGTDPVGVLNEAGRLLSRMARSAGLDYETPELTVIQREARRLGGAAKFSGAGGGDCAIALFSSPESEAAFRRRMAVVGLPVVPAAVAPGAHRDTGVHA